MVEVTADDRATLESWIRATSTAKPATRRRTYRLLGLAMILLSLALALPAGASAPTETLAGTSLIASLPTGSSWPVDYTAATYTPGHAVIALRFDDGTIYDWDYTIPMLAERGLVAGFAVNNTRIDGHAAYTTTAQFLKAESLGNEIMCHSRSHDVDPATPAEFYDETVTAAAELIALGFNVRSFVQPGSWTTTYNIDFNHGWTVGCAADLVLRANFAAYEGYLYGSW